MQHNLPQTIAITPSTIKIDASAIPATIKIEGEIPTEIKIDASAIPATIKIEGEIPTEINVNHSIPTEITVSGVPDTITASGIPDTITASGIPSKITVESNIPQSITVNVSCPSSGGASYVQTYQNLNDDFEDDFDESIRFELDTADIGIPSEIKILSPEFPEIIIKHDLPDFIPIVSQLPDKIELYQSQPMLHSHEIKMINDHVIPKTIEIVSKDIPKSIILDTKDLPSHINLQVPDIPDIKVDASSIPEFIKVIGVPDTIEVKMPEYITAKLELPEGLEVPLVYKGGPVPVKFESSLLGDEDRPCFALVPCDPKK